MVPESVPTLTLGLLLGHRTVFHDIDISRWLSRPHHETPSVEGTWVSGLSTDNLPKDVSPGTSLIFKQKRRKLRQCSHCGCLLENSKCQACRK